MEAGAELTCQRHGRPTRITCVTCDTPICPECAIRTPVGFKCPDHATKPAPPRRSRVGRFAVPLVILALVGFAQLARTTGRGDPVKPPCPTETAPDVGIGSAGGDAHWKDMARAEICGRYHAAAAWTGKEFLVWGGTSCAGTGCPSPSAPSLGDGGAYNPRTDRWRKIGSSPLGPRAGAASAWTGTELLVWGGTTAAGPLADGAAYDPAKDKWRRLSDPPIGARADAAAVWTGREFLVWGTDDIADGAAYDPASDTWRMLSPSPLSGRSNAVSTWTGRELLIWGGVHIARNQDFNDGAAYDPAANAWRRVSASPLRGRDAPAAAWTGQELVLWGGLTSSSGFVADGAAYNPSTDRWRPLPPVALAPRSGAASVWTGKELVVWGGFGALGSPGTDATGGALDGLLVPRSAFATLGDGAAYNPATNTWRSLEQVQLVARGFPLSAWDGEHALVWGGLVVVAAPASAADGVRYTP